MEDKNIITLAKPAIILSWKMTDLLALEEMLKETQETLSEIILRAFETCNNLFERAYKHSKEIITNQEDKKNYD